VKQNNPTGDTKKADIYGLAGTYNFSKRTAAYVTYGKTHNNATAAFPLVNAEGSVVAGAAGASPAGLGIGLKTEF
jgi:predicted porin